MNCVVSIERLASPLRTLAARTAAKPIIRDTAVTTALGVVGRSSNFIVPFLIGAWFGISEATDVLFFALAFLVFCTGLFGFAIEAVMVPFVAKLRREDIGGVGAFVGGLISVLGLYVILLVPLIACAKPILARSANFSGPSLNLLFQLLLELIPVLFLVTVSSVFSGTLNAYQIFWGPAISTTVSLGAVIGVAYACRNVLGVQAVILGFAIGEGCRLVFLWQLLRRHGLGPLRFVWPLRPGVIEFLKVSSFQILGMGFAGLPPLINRSIASYWGPGSVSLVEYAEKMFYVPAGILGSGFLTVILSHWAKNFHEEGSDRFRHHVYHVTKLIGGLGLLAAVVLFALRYSLAFLALGWGKISQDKIVEVGQLFGFYVLGLLPNVVGLVVGRGHLVLKNTRILMQAALVAVAVLLALNRAITPHWDLRGIALANAGTQWAVCFYLFWTFRVSMEKQAH